MKTYSKDIQVRWSDLDPNFHLRHSVYYDWGAFCRIEFLNEFGLSAGVMGKLHIGPILFREECIFRKEVRLGDPVTINLQVIKGRKDYSRWSIRHQVTKNGDELCAVLTVEGTWMDTVQRKLATPPEEVYHMFEKMPKAEGFEWI